MVLFFALEDYSDDIEYMSDEFIKKVSEIILYAKSEGLEIWLEAKPTEPPEVGMLSSWLNMTAALLSSAARLKEVLLIIRIPLS